MNEQNITTEVNEIRNIVDKEIEYNENYPSCFVIKNVALPEGWSKNETDILFLKNEDEWEVNVDGDIDAAPENIKDTLAMFTNEGWCKLHLDKENLSKASDIINYLSEDLDFGFTASTAVKQDETIDLGIIRNIITYRSEDIINILYEYLGEEAIITQEIYDINNNLVRILDVKESSEGWVSQQWDGKNDSGEELPNGFYFLKLRSAQRVGEIFKVEIIHKQTSEQS